MGQLDSVRNILAVIGGIVASLVTIGGGVAVFWRLLRPSLRVKVTGEHFEIQFLPGAEKELNRFDDLLKDKTQYRIISAGDVETEWDKIYAQRPAIIFGEYFDGPVFRLRHYWKFCIHNVGRVAVDDLKLHLPFDGMCLIDRPGTEAAEKFDREISIGSIRPGTKALKVEVWSSVAPFMLRSDELFVSHPGGSVRVKIGEMLYGWQVKLVTDMGGWFNLLCVLVGAMLVTSLIGLVGNHINNSAATRPSVPTTQSP